MPNQIKINKLIGWSQLTENILRSVADFNATGQGLTTIAQYENYVHGYNNNYPKGIFDYSTKRPDRDTLEIYADDELLLSITMCTVNELVMNENY